MKFILLIIALTHAAFAELHVTIDIETFGKELGGWKARKGKAVDYIMSESKYRTYRPIITETPEGGHYISIRIDDRRGKFSSDDHALLQVTIDQAGKLLSVQSSVHSQGKSVKSDLITTTGKKAAAVLSKDPIMNAGMSLVQDLTSKLSSQTKAEPGRVIFPAVIIHNYNKLFKAIKVEEVGKAVIVKPEENVPKEAE